MTVIGLSSASSPSPGWKLLLARLPWRGLVVPVGLIVFLELLARLTGFHKESVPLPSEIVEAFFRAIFDGTIFGATAQSMSAALGGLAVGAAIGLALGIAFGVFPVFFWLMEFTVEVIRPIPSVALIPVALMIFAFGYTMEISLIAKNAIWPILFVTHAAIGGIDRRQIEVARLLKLGFFNTVRKIVIPAVMPAIFVGIRLSMGLALLLTIAIEIAVNPQGLGYVMMRAGETFQADLMFALLFWTGLLGWAINAILQWVQHRYFDYLAVGQGS